MSLGNEPAIALVLQGDVHRIQRSLRPLDDDGTEATVTQLHLRPRPR